MRGMARTLRPGSASARGIRARTCATVGGNRRRSDRMARLRAVWRLALASVLSVALVWLASTEDQRRGYLTMLGLWKATAALGGKHLRLAAFGSDVEIAHCLPRPIAAPPSSVPTTDGTRYARTASVTPVAPTGRRTRPTRPNRRSIAGPMPMADPSSVISHRGVRTPRSSV